MPPSGEVEIDPIGREAGRQHLLSAAAWRGAKIVLLSDGTSQLDMRGLPWSRIERPVHPLDRDISWSPEQGLYGDR